MNKELKQVSNVYIFLHYANRKFTLFNMQESQVPNKGLYLHYCLSPLLN